MRSKGPRVLLTNDDGISALGLHEMVVAIELAGIEAVVIAPAENRSGWARRATFSSPVTIEEIDPVGAIRRWRCSGSPVDCVRVGLLADVAPLAEVVISGINLGPNLGDDALLSATVGAAIEGALLGCTGLAVSQQDRDDQFGIFEVSERGTYAATAATAARLAEAILKKPPDDRAVLNLNAPPDSRNAPLRVCRPGRRYYRRGSLRPASPSDPQGTNGYLTFGSPGDPPAPFESTAETDFGAIADGAFALTPIDLDLGLPASRKEWALHAARGEWMASVVSSASPEHGSASPEHDHD